MRDRPTVNSSTAIFPSFHYPPLLTGFKEQNMRNRLHQIGLLVIGVLVGVAVSLN